MSGWTTPADVRAKARRRWENGSLLAAYVLEQPCPVLEVPVRGPGVREIGADLAGVRAWQTALVEGSAGGRRYELREREVGGRAIGRMRLPGRVVLSAYEQYWALLGVSGDVEALDAVTAATAFTHPELLPWVARRARTAIDLAHDWAVALRALDWLAAESGQGRYLREVTAFGVDTKFIESHQGALGELLGMMHASRTEGSGSPPCAPGLGQGQGQGRSFAARAGFREVEPLIHLRVDPALAALPGLIDEVALPLRHAASLAIDPVRVIVVENRVSYLSLPIPARGVVVWGHGFDALRLGGLAWLRACSDVSYWGDLDTHGFAILNGLRRVAPEVGSLLMDRATLFAHQDRWVVEPKPTRADLAELTGAERALYEDLVEGVYGAKVRLEQERIDWAHVLAALDRLS